MPPVYTHTMVEKPDDNERWQRAAESFVKTMNRLLRDNFYSLDIFPTLKKERFEILGVTFELPLPYKIVDEGRRIYFRGTGKSINSNSDPGKSLKRMEETMQPFLEIASVVVKGKKFLQKAETLAKEGKSIDLIKREAEAAKDEFSRAIKMYERIVEKRLYGPEIETNYYQS